MGPMNDRDAVLFLDHRDDGGAGAACSRRPVRATARLRNGRLAWMGTRRGWGRYPIFHADGRVCFVELKRQGETLDDDQDVIAEHMIRAGHGYLWTASFDEAVETLKAWGVLRSGIRVQ
jgi:hypothetical protein